MYFLYVDGSGQTKIKPNRKSNRWYILSGVIVHEGDWRDIEKNLAEVKKEAFPEQNPEDLELHAYSIWNNQVFLANEKLNLTLAKKREVFSRVLDLVCKSKITLINTVISKDKMRARYTEPRLMEYSWMFILERFEGFLKLQPGWINDGLVFVDSSQKVPESEIRDIIQRLVREGSPQQRIDHVIEDPIFIKSHLRNLIQLADMIAYVVYKHHKGDPQFKDWFEMLKPKMYARDGRLDGSGLKKFP